MQIFISLFDGQQQLETTSPTTRYITYNEWRAIGRDLPLASHQNPLIYGDRWGKSSNWKWGHEHPFALRPDGMRSRAAATLAG